MIFDRFTQAESDTTKKFGGTGLGLAICKKLIEHQSSEIKVESKLGKGTKFFFDLEFEIVSNAKRTEVAQANISDFKLDGVKLLVVDDNEINLIVVKQFLNKWNVKYDDAKDGEQALEQIKKNKYDLVLLDLQMPIKDGFAVAKEVRLIDDEYYKNLPLIALSASVSSDITDRVLHAGMNDYLCKPFEPEVLFQKIKLYSSHKDLFGVK